MQLEHNFNNAANFIRSAAAQGAELAVLPEYHLTNWLPKDPEFVSLCEQWEVYLNKYRDLARECGICRFLPLSTWSKQAWQEARGIVHM
jgi:predicted amidohydrolase